MVNQIRIKMRRYYDIYVVVRINHLWKSEDMGYYNFHTVYIWFNLI